MRRGHISFTVTHHSPVKGTLKREGPTRIEHPVPARAGELDDQCRQPSLNLIREHPLGIAEIGASPHAKTAIEPVLLSNPVKSLNTIPPLGTQRVIAASGLVPTARSLDNNRISTLGPHATNNRGKGRVEPCF